MTIIPERGCWQLAHFLTLPRSTAADPVPCNILLLLIIVQPQMLAPRLGREYAMRVRDAVDWASRKWSRARNVGSDCQEAHELPRCQCLAVALSISVSELARVFPATVLEHLSAPTAAAAVCDRLALARLFECAFLWGESSGRRETSSIIESTLGVQLFVHAFVSDMRRGAMPQTTPNQRGWVKAVDIHTQAQFP